MLAGAHAPAAAQRAGENPSRDTAQAATRQVAGAGNSLPQLLAPVDAARLRRIFELQARADFANALRETEALADRRLLGHVLADRWLRDARPEPSAADLSSWLGAYADHPDATRLHAMLVARAPRGTPMPPAPRDNALAEGDEEVPEEREPATRSVPRNAALERSVRDRLRDGDSNGALAAISRTRGIAVTEAARLRAEVALWLFQQGRDEEALAVAASNARSAPSESWPAFVAGLAAWGAQRYDTAAGHFEVAARAEGGSPALRSAAAFWTARSAVRARRPNLYVPWLLQAAQEPRSFYGILARQSLGLPMGFAWAPDQASGNDAAALAETAAGWRALALLQIGQRGRAEAELRRLWPLAQGNPLLSRGMLAVASQANLTDLAAQLAALVQTADGRPRDYARFPMPALQPEGGFRVDPALLYALARQESNFEPRAVSSAGARGLMQLMPATAAYVANDPSLRSRSGHARLHDPAFSLEIGQRYLHYLAAQSTVEGDLVRLLAAYNSGPGNVARWLPAARHRDDPLLFIESIPVMETRQFVQRVLAYSWIYASRLGLPSASLDALSAGRSPRFQGVEEVTVMLSRTPIRRVSAR